MRVNLSVFLCVYDVLLCLRKVDLRNGKAEGRVVRTCKIIHNCTNLRAINANDAFNNRKIEIVYLTKF